MKYGISVENITYIYIVFVTTKKNHFVLVISEEKIFFKVFSQSEPRISQVSNVFCQIKTKLDIFDKDLTIIISAKFGSNWPISFRQRNK